jgi:hypothetical protein
LKAVEGEYYVYTQADISLEDEERNYTSEVIMNEGKENVESEDENVPADNTEEDQEGKCTSEAGRNKMQVALENEFYECVHVEVAIIVVHEGNYMTGAGVNNVHRNENEGVEIEFHENRSVPAICYKCEMIREKYSLQENSVSHNDPIYPRQN